VTSETAAEAFARLYDLDLEREQPGDVAMYLELADRTGGRILELAVGSGRLAVPLAMAGHRVTGVDLDEAMLHRARERAASAGASVGRLIRLVHADLLGLRLPDAGSYDLAILGLNSLFLLPSRTTQQTALTTLAEHLRPGGRAIVDIWLPAADDLARYDGRLLLDAVVDDPATGRTVTKSWSATHDPRTGAVTVTTIYDEGPPGTAPVRWIRRDPMRLVSPAELEGFAAAAGLEVEILAGGYDLHPLEPGDERAVLVARRP
jgi:SAM-dependent methyltransferase